jgi:hypothetical protein
MNQRSTIQAYQLTRGGTAARLSLLRRMASNGDWRGARHWTLASYADAYGTLGPGTQETVRGYRMVRERVWLSHTGEQFRDERFADQCEGGPDHTGWFTNCEGLTGKDGTGTARGIVARLPHGRFIAGYYWGDNGERVYFADVFDAERDAVRMSDEHARVFAERQQEHDARFQAMTDAERDAEKKLIEAQKAIALRHDPRFGEFQAAREAIETLRKARQTLADKTREYDNG